MSNGSIRPIDRTLSGAVALKRYSTFPESLLGWNLIIKYFRVIPSTLVEGDLLLHTYIYWIHTDAMITDA